MTAPLARLGPALVVSALVGATLTAAPGPAAAESAPLGYDCNVQFVGGNQIFYAVIDTDAPASLAAGASVSVTTTSEVTVPAAVVDVVRSAGAKTVGGTATATGYVDGVARETTLAISRSPVPETTGVTMDLVGSGPSGSVTAGVAGTTIVLTAGDFTGSITGYDASDAAIQTATFSCVLQPEQLVGVDTISVVPTATSTSVTVQVTPVEYGDTPNVSATVTAPGTTIKPSGTIAFTFEGQTVNAEVKGGKARLTSLAQALHLGKNAVSAVFTPTDPDLAVSQSVTSFRVVKADSISQVSAVYRRALHRIVARDKVFAAYGTEVSGRVTYVLQRNGVAIRTRTVDLNRWDVAKVRFGSVHRRGVYTVVAHYLGSATLKRSSGSFRLEI